MGNAKQLECSEKNIGCLNQHTTTSIPHWLLLYSNIRDWHSLGSVVSRAIKAMYNKLQELNNAIWMGGPNYYILWQPTSSSASNKVAMTTKF